MKRSDFLKTLGLTGVGIVIPNTILAQKPVKIYDNYIKGLVHYNYKQVKKQLSVGQELTLVRELTNTYDSFAVAVFYLMKIQRLLLQLLQLKYLQLHYYYGVFFDYY